MDRDKNKVEEVAQILGLKPNDIRGWMKLKGKKLSRSRFIPDSAAITSDNQEAEDITQALDAKEDSGRDTKSYIKKHTDEGLQKRDSGNIDIIESIWNFYDKTFKNIMKKGQLELLEQGSEKGLSKQANQKEQEKYWEEFASRVILISKSINLGMPEDEFVKRVGEDEVYLQDFNKFLELLYDLTPDKYMISLLMKIFNN